LNVRQNVTVRFGLDMAAQCPDGTANLAVLSGNLPGGRSLSRGCKREFAADLKSRNDNGL